jgi:tetratricopeptide (TPR) repeat protein
MSVCPTGATVTDESRWERLTALFDELLAGANPEAVLLREPDAEIRREARELWEQHQRAAAEDFLSSPMPFEVLPVFRPGDRLLNRFRIEHMLGSGGMGEVYRAFDERIEEPVAIKTIARLLAHSPAIRRRIAAEVQNARRVTHPNVCRIHEIFDDGETVFFSMELVEGKLLSDLLTEPMPRSRALVLVRQIAEGLHAAHRNGVIHGDLKPANVIVADGTAPRAVLMDFGLARAVEMVGPSTHSTLSIRGGTADYMAPELYSGAPPSIRSDIFAFGKLASGILPKERIWAQCLRPHPEERLGSLETVIQRLEPGSTRRYWIGGAVLAAGGLVAYDVHRAARSGAALPNGARILVNGFRGAGAIARLARGLFVTGLAHSSRVHPLEDEVLLPALRKLEAGAGLPANGRVLESLLTNLRAAFWIEGQIEQMGGRTTLLLRLLRSDDRRLLAENGFRDFGTVMAAAQAAANWLRRVSGESEKSLELNRAEATTYQSALPEALSKYYDAMECYAVADTEQAVPLLREALRLDPNFAQAHAMLSSCLNGNGDFEEGFHEAERAMQLSSRLPDLDRTGIESMYWAFAGNSARAVDACRRNLNYHPDEPRYFRVLARNLARSGKPAEALLYNRKAITLAPDDGMLRNELVENLALNAQFDEALQTYQERADLARSTPYTHRGQAMALMGLERYDEAGQAFDSIPLDVPCWVQTPRILAGDLERAIASLREAAERAETSHIAKDRFEIAEFLCGLYVLSGRPQLAVPQIRRMLELPQVPFSARYLAAVAFWSARAGDAPSLTEARNRLADIAARWPSEDAQSWLDHADALLALRERDFTRAETLLVRSSSFAGSRWSVMDLADLYAARGNPEAAEAEWQTFESKRGMFLSEFFPGVLILGWLDRAIVARARRDAATSRKYTQKVWDHWGRKNPQLPIVQLAANLLKTSF